MITTEVSTGSVLVLVVSKTITVIFGTLLTALAWRAQRRTGSAALRALAFGIGLVTLGTLSGGVLHQVVGVDLVVGVGVQSVFTALGFAVMTYSVYAADHGTDTVSAVRTGQSD